jgi:hypothetical protein
MIVCVLSLFVFYLSFSTNIFAQDSANDEKTAQHYDETIADTALDLDGDFSYVETVDSDALNTINKQVTITAWIKATDFPNRYAPILYKGDERTPDISNRSYVMFLRDDGAIQFASSPKGQREEYIFSPSGAISLNKWYHVAGVVDTKRDTIRVFVDGIEAGRTTFWDPKVFMKVYFHFELAVHTKKQEKHILPLSGKLMRLVFGTLL